MKHAMLGDRGFFFTADMADWGFIYCQVLLSVQRCGQPHAILLPIVGCDMWVLLPVPSSRGCEERGGGSVGCHAARPRLWLICRISYSTLRQ